MITIEEKINVFTKIVLEKAQAEYDQKLKEITESNDKRIEEYKKELDKRCSKLIEDLVAKGETEKNRLISKAKLEEKRMVLNKMEEFIERLEEDIIARTEQYTNTDKYIEYMKVSITKILSSIQGDQVTLYMLDRDKEKLQGFINSEMKKYNLNESQINITKPKNNILGGLIAVNKEETERFDYSLATIINENKLKTGQLLNEALKR